MTRKLKLFVALFAIVGIISIAAVFTARKPALRIGIVEWPGFYPLVCANERGDFVRAGLDVKMLTLADNPAANRAFQNNELDIIGGTLVDVIMMNSSKHQARIFFVADQSAESDALMAKSDIKSPENLRGKIISFEKVNSFSHVFVLQLLKKFGISESEVSFKDIPHGNVPKELAQGTIDAGHTWDPYKAEAIKNGFHMLGSAADVPGSIMDIFAYNPTTLANRTKELATFLKVLQGVEFARWSDPNDECVRLVAKYHKKKAEEIITSYPGVIHMKYVDQDVWLSKTSPADLTVSKIANFISGVLEQNGQITSRPDFDFMVDFEPIGGRL